MEPLTVVLLIWIIVSVIAVPIVSWEVSQSFLDWQLSKHLPKNDERRNLARHHIRRALELAIIQYVDLMIGITAYSLPDSDLKSWLARVGLVINKILLVVLIINLARVRRRIMGNGREPH